MTVKCTMILGDCLEVMPGLPNKCDFVFADIPYGVLNAHWDKKIPLDKLWGAINAVCRPNSAVCIMATQPYASDVVASNRKNFSYDLVWVKGRGTGSFQARQRPMRAHESMLLFNCSSAKYIPQMRPACRDRRGTISKPSYPGSVFGPIAASRYTYGDYVYPLSWMRYEPDHARNKQHSSQKPISMIQWLVSSYCTAGGTVIDPTAGSFTTCVAAASCGRSSIGIERDEGYFEAGVERMRKHIRDNLLDVRLEVRK